ncbi:hypothetical protein GIY21_20415 [Xanthomonas sontii]|uniref:Uncharacterized protein n=1 Tax=Xanthomonas sontii TaxID=2650745 RepID=A0A6N7QEC0_9XANT|nr:hypothetical protein [Xanthomonas sontii]MRH02669.1 hypothetical protein [Xanthomonas sontii]MRH76989.1 hypothetical protein [Xanthomonas sontii]
MTSNSKTAAHIFTCRSLGGKKNVAYVVVPADPENAEVFDLTKAGKKQVASRFSPVQRNFEEARRALEAIPPTALSFNKSIVKFFDFSTGAQVIEFYWIDDLDRMHTLAYQIELQGSSFVFQRAQNLVAATGTAQVLSDKILKKKSKAGVSVSVSRKASLPGPGGRKRSGGS